MINGVIVKKLEAMDRTLDELRSLGELAATEIDSNWMLRRAVERDLQVLAEIVIDICQRLIALAGKTPATTAVEAIEGVQRLGALSDTGRYSQIVRFRNFVVHHYDRVDAAVLAQIVNEELTDFERFRDEVTVYATRED